MVFIPCEVSECVRNSATSFCRVEAYRIGLPDPFLTHGYVNVAEYLRIPPLASLKSANDLKFVYNLCSGLVNFPHCWI